MEFAGKVWPRRVLTAALPLLLGACAMGPDFSVPDPPASASYTTGPQPETTVAADGVAQRFVASRDIPADWWTLYESPKLDQLVRMALEASPTLAQARARLVQAQEALGARTTATLWPSLDASAGVSRKKVDPAALGIPSAPAVDPFTLYHVGIDVSYTVDVFGGARRELEALAAGVDVRRYELIAARLALTANTVTAVIRQAKLRAQIASTRSILDARSRQLAIAEERLRLGSVASVDVASQRALVAEARATLPPLERELAQTSHALAIYAGVAPGDAVLPIVELSDLTLPRDVPVTLPADLVRQRPDIRASEALLHSACARIGVAKAILFPRLTLFGSVASDRTEIEEIFGRGTNVYNFGFSLLQPLLHMPELQARKREAIAAFDEAEAAYRLAVLTGLANVADALRALEQDANALAARSEQVREAEAAYAIMVERNRLGGASQLELLDAERERLRAELDRLEATADRLADTAALLQAMGGGWWEREESAPVSDAR